MLLQVNNNNINKKFLYKYRNYNSFFVFNIKENIFINRYFDKNVFHIKQVNRLFKDCEFSKLFSGDIFFCFVELKEFFNKLIDLYYINVDNKYKLISICYNGYFLNFNLKIGNVVNCLFLNFSIVFFLILVFVNLFFFKIIFFLRKNLNINKC